MQQIIVCEEKKERVVRMHSMLKTRGNESESTDEPLLKASGYIAVFLGLVLVSIPI